MSGSRVTTFRLAPLEAGQKIRILEGPRRGDWLVLDVDGKKMRLKCPVSGREVEWDRFASFAATLENAEWPLKNFSETVARQEKEVAAVGSPADSAEAEERYRMLVERSPLAICIHQDGVFVYINPAGVELLGAKSASEIVGRRVLDFVHPDDHTEVTKRVRLMEQGEVAPRNEELFVRVDGTFFTAEAVAWPVLFRGSHAIQVVVSDISERKSLEKALNRAQEISHLGSWTFKPSTGITSWSEELYRIFAVDPSSFNPSSTDFIEAVHPLDLVRVAEALKKARREHLPYRIAHRIVRPGGEVRHLAVAAEWEFDLHDGKPVLIGTALDVTDKVNLEAELRQAQKMEALGTLAGGVAHDFNNILSAVLGYTELSYGLAKEGSPLEKYLSEVLKAGRRARDLVKQILAFSRRTDEKKGPVDLGRAVADTLTMLRATIPSTIAITTSFPEERTFTWGSPSQVQQVVANLVTNAYHAVRDRSGSIAVKVEHRDPAVPRQLTVGEITESCYVVLTVTDDGPGIPEEMVEKIFDPFFTTKEIGEGTGLGLSVVHGIVSSMGGGIEVKGGHGEGASFSVFLPCSEPGSEQEEEQPRGFTLAPRSLDILFVDDENSLAELGMTLLQSLGHKAEAASDSTAAFRLVESRDKAFDLIISDQTMPGMTGLQLLKRVGNLWPTTASILCTGYSDAINEEALKNAGVGVLLMKPFSREKLEKAIAEALNARAKSQ